MQDVIIVGARCAGAPTVLLLARRVTEFYSSIEAIMPVPIGDESVSRIAHRRLAAKNIAAMNIEYPVVAVGESRFQLRAMASHTVEEGIIAARLICESIQEARAYVNDRIRSCREASRGC